MLLYILFYVYMIMTMLIIVIFVNYCILFVYSFGPS